MREVETNIACSGKRADRMETKSLSLGWRPGQSDIIAGIVLLAIFFTVSLPRMKGPIDLRWDASTYYILGTALAEGKGYRLLNEPGNIQAVQYPPLLPSIIAMYQRTMGTSDYIPVGRALRLTYFLLSGLYLLAVYTLARRMLPPLHAFFASAIIGLSFNSFFYPSETLYAELPFALVSILFLLSYRKQGNLYGIGAGALACAAYLLRTAGIVLLVVWIIEGLIRQRWKQAAIRAAVAVVPILAWQCYIWQVTHSEEYQHPIYPYQRAAYDYPNVTYSENSSLKDPFQPEVGRSKTSDLFMRIARNVLAIPVALGESSWIGRPLLRYPLLKLSRTVSGSQQVVLLVFDICLFAVGLGALAGAVLIARGDEWLLSLYFGLTLAIVVLTPWQSQFWRYLSPIAPLIIMFFVVALRTGRDAVGHRFTKPVAVTNLLIAVLLSAMLLVQAGIAFVFLHNMLPVSYYDSQEREHTFRALTYEPHWHALDRAFEWIRRNAKPEAVVATSVPQLAYLRSEHKAVLPPFELNPDRAIELLDQVPASYLVVDDLKRPPISDRYAARLVRHRPGDWKLVYTSPGELTQVYERIR
jgi:hypothetical protein